MFWRKPPAILSHVFQEALWKVPTEEKVIYLTFDDGPHAALTPFIIDQLKQYHFSATFFCLGESIEKNKELFERLKEEGFGIGNHTFSHLDGWKTSTKKYLEDIKKAQAITKSNLFRPPHGRITWNQWKQLKVDYQIVMWNLMPEDFRQDITSEIIFKRLIDNISPGNIVVLHENDKSIKNCKYLLPRYLSLLKSKGYIVKKLPDANRHSLTPLS